MKRILVTNLIMQRDLEEFRSLLRENDIEAVPHAVTQFLKEAELLPIIGQFDGVLAGDDQFTARVLRAGLPRLKVISKWGVGLDSIDLEAAKELGIRVFNTPGAFGDAVAEVALGYLLMLSRKLHLIDRQVRGGCWPKLEGEGLGGKVLGLAGFGAVGKATARRALAFGMEALATDPYVNADNPEEGVSRVSFDELVSRADYLCLCCNLTPENRGMVGEREFSKMKRSAYLINVARGALVDEQALIRALQEKAIAGAALDVYETEPLPSQHPFTRIESVILGSHNANNLKSANDYVNRVSMENLLTGLRNGAQP